MLIRVGRPGTKVWHLGVHVNDREPIQGLFGTKSRTVPICSVERVPVEWPILTGAEVVAQGRHACTYCTRVARRALDMVTD